MEAFIALDSQPRERQTETERQTDRQRQTDRHTDRHTDKQTRCLGEGGAIVERIKKQTKQKAETHT